MRSTLPVLLGCAFLIGCASTGARASASAPENPRPRSAGAVGVRGDTGSMEGPYEKGARMSVAVQGPGISIVNSAQKKASDTGLRASAIKHVADPEASSSSPSARSSPEQAELSRPALAAVDGEETSETPTDSTEKTADSLPVGVDVFPFVGTSSAAPYEVRSVSLNIFGGISGGVRVVEIGAMLNLTAGDVRGAQLSGVINGIEGSIRGFQGAGTLNFARQSVTGVQGAGVSNIAFKGVSGVQGAGALNLTLQSASGVQGAGVLNVALENVEGLQVAGALNVAGGHVKGAQLSPFNVALNDVEGVQLGIVNIAEKSTASIGLLNILFDGFLDLETFSSLNGLTMASLRHGGDHVFNVYNVGFYPSGEDVLPVFGLGIGWRRVVSPAWEVSVDVTSSRIGRFDDSSGSVVTKLRPLIGWRPAGSISVFGGPTLNLQSYDADFSPGSVAPYETRRWDEVGGDTTLILWPGFTLGVRFL